MDNDQSRRTEDKDKLTAIQIAVLSIQKDVKHHVDSQTQANKRADNAFLKIESEIKDQRMHFDGIINDNRVHFDERISTCNASINRRLEEHYMTRAQIKAENESEIIVQMSKRQEEIKTARKEILQDVDRQVGGLKRLLYGFLIITLTVVGIVVSFFRGQ